MSIQLVVSTRSIPSVVPLPVSTPIGRRNSELGGTSSLTRRRSTTRTDRFDSLDRPEKPFLSPQKIRISLSLFSSLFFWFLLSFCLSFFSVSAQFSAGNQQRRRPHGGPFKGGPRSAKLSRPCLSRPCHRHWPLHGLDLGPGF